MFIGSLIHVGPFVVSANSSFSPVVEYLLVIFFITIDVGITIQH